MFGFYIPDFLTVFVFPILAVIGLIVSIIFFVKYTNRLKNENEELIIKKIKNKRILALIGIILFGIIIFLYIGIPILLIILLSTGLIGM